MALSLERLAAAGHGTFSLGTVLARSGSRDDAPPSDERAAFEFRMRAAWPGVVRLVERLLAWPGGTAEVEDVAQETFLAAWRARHEFRGESAWTTWVHSIAVRRAHNAGRARERRQRWFGRLWSGGEDDSLEAAAVTPHSRVESTEDAVAFEVRDALKRLRQQDREVLVLRYLEGRTVEELAGLLQLSAAAVNTRLSRARARLRPFLGAGLESLDREEASR